jgi:phosphatidylinositol-3-phosphatase
MKKHTFRFIVLLLTSQTSFVSSQTALPKPDHVVVAILESHGYTDLIGSPAAPYINALANDTLSAVFTESYAITHPSQPNYLVLYSGSTLGVADNQVPIGNPFTTANLGRQLIDSGKSFITYSEDLPEVGYNGATSGFYARKHNPVTNWMGTGINQVPATTNQPFTAFPSKDFTLLPTVCFVVPNLINDMHNGTDPDRIANGDTWISKNLDSYIQWAKANNSVFILTFDEERDTVDNHIITIFTGQMVKAGKYITKINHYSTLHTFEKMYGLPFAGDSLTYAPITYCWKGNSAASVSSNISNSRIYPNPNYGFLFIELSGQDATAEIYNSNGCRIKNIHLDSSKTAIHTGDLLKGFYILKIKSKEGVVIRKMIRN